MAMATMGRRDKDRSPGADSSGCEEPGTRPTAPLHLDGARKAEMLSTDLGLIETSTDTPLPFPDLDGAEERRMENLLAGRLFRHRAPQRIGRYALLDRLGSGGMGVVYAAFDAELDRRVAIKVIRSDILSTSAEARLRREAQAMAKVVHANVVAVIEVGAHDDQIYVAMEYVRGRSLAVWGEDERSWRELLGAYVQAGRGLAAAHRAGVIHRDFKPQNAMIVAEGPDAGRVKVLDFGLAQAADTQPPADEASSPARDAGAFAAHLTATGALMGTPVYMAPEQLLGERANERSDQYSFGVSLYESLYGELPFTGSTLPALVRSVLNDPLPRPPSGGDVPQWVYRILVRALARDPALRFESMTALCDALERDPSARLRSYALAFGLCAAIGGSFAVASLSVEAPSPCSGPEFDLAGIWDAARADAVRDAFAATGEPHAEKAAARSISLLDDYTTRWTSARVGACESQLRGAVSANLFDLEMACLGRHRASLRSLSDLLVDADAALIERATQAAYALPSVDACAPAVLLRDVPEPEDAASAAAVRDLREELAATTVLVNAGRLDEAGESLTSLATRAKEAGFLPVIAEISLAQATVGLEQRRAEAAAEALDRAVSVAIEVGAEHIAAEALARRIFVHGMVGESAAALADAELTAAYTRRFADDHHLRWLYLNNLGVATLQAGDADAARSLFEAAIALDEGPTPLERAWSHANLGITARRGRDLVAALESSRAAVDVAVNSLGPEHPLVRTFRAYEAAALMALGRQEEAQALLERLLIEIEGSNDAVHLSFWPRIFLARIAHSQRRDADARALAEHALAVVDASDLRSVIEAELVLAYALAGAGEVADARAHRDKVLALIDDNLDATDSSTLTLLMTAAEEPDAFAEPAVSVAILRRTLRIHATENGRRDPTTALNRALLADALLALGEPREALGLSQEAVATYRSLSGDNTIDLAHALSSRGRALLAVDEPELAAAALEEAAALLAGRVDADDPELAHFRVELARALFANGAGATSATEALELAEATYRSLGPRFASELESIEALRSASRAHPDAPG